MSQRKREIFMHEFLTRLRSEGPDGVIGSFVGALREAGNFMDLDLDELRKHYYEQLPMIAAMMLPEGKVKPQVVAKEAILLVETILEVLEEELEEDDDDDR